MEGLSETARKIIMDKAKQLGLTELSVLELFVLENGPSDSARNVERRNQAWEECKRRFGDELTPVRAFHAGYSAGWIRFQTRHSDDPKIRHLFGMKSLHE